MSIHCRLLVLIAIVFTLACSGTFEKDASLRITIGEDAHYKKENGMPRPTITLENSLFSALVATGKGGRCGIEGGIYRWVQKETGTNQVANVIDANYMRGPVLSAVITETGPDSQQVLIEFEDLPDKDQDGLEEDNYGRVAYTIFSNSPMIRIDYIDRLPCPDPIVDLGAPGGIRKMGGGFSKKHATRVYGQQNFHAGELVCHPATYWTNVEDDPHMRWESGPEDAGSLNYRNYIIIAVASDSTGEGYGRVVPIHRNGVQGGARHLKLLWHTGIEFYTKPWTDNKFGRSEEEQTYNPAFTAYLYCFTGGLDRAIEMGKAIADGDRNY